MLRLLPVRAKASGRECSLCDDIGLLAIVKVWPTMVGRGDDYARPSVWPALFVFYSNELWTFEFVLLCRGHFAGGCTDILLVASRECYVDA